MTPFALLLLLAAATPHAGARSVPKEAASAPADEASEQAGAEPQGAPLKRAVPPDDRSINRAIREFRAVRLDRPERLAQDLRTRSGLLLGIVEALEERARRARAAGDRRAEVDALCRRPLLLLELAESLRGMVVPVMLSAEQAAEYRRLLEEQAAPLEASAHQGCADCVEVATAAGVDTPAVRAARELARKRPPPPAEAPPVPIAR